jgi:predicted Fe-Mo cluster-binding NifX family protein
MKFAVPTHNGKICLHFGHCEVFTLIDIDEETKTITGKEEKVPPPHEPGVLPRWLSEQGADVIIAGGMGSRAQALFGQYNIKVVVGSEETDPEKAALAYLNGTLKSGVNACDH